MEYQLRTPVSTEYQTDTHDTRLILAEQLADDLGGPAQRRFDVVPP